MKNPLIAIILTAILSGCAHTDPITITTVPLERIPLVVPTVDPYSNRNVEWIVVTPENAKQVFEDLKKHGKAVVLFALTDKGYENLALNVGDQIKITKQMQAVIDAYKKYYLEVEKRDETHNQKLPESK